MIETSRNNERGFISDQCSIRVVRVVKVLIVYHFLRMRIMNINTT